jgi:hypothetical protein
MVLGVKITEVRKLKRFNITMVRQYLVEFRDKRLRTNKTKAEQTQK